jgi:hypothetical protein
MPVLVGVSCLEENMKVGLSELPAILAIWMLLASTELQACIWEAWKEQAPLFVLGTLVCYVLAYVLGTYPHWGRVIIISQVGLHIWLTWNIYKILLGAIPNQALWWGIPTLYIPTVMVGIGIALAALGNKRSPHCLR